jgi:putative transposase
MQYVTTEHSLRRRWARVNEFFENTQQKDFWVDINHYLRHLVKDLIEVSLDEEMIQYTQTQPYQRAGANRMDYRNGYYCRNLDTTFGPIERITIPRSRQGLFKPSVFKRYQRRQEAVNDVVCNVFLRGISTRDVAEA